jgi:hypothetical protein
MGYRSPVATVTTEAVPAGLEGGRAVQVVPDQDVKSCEGWTLAAVVK